MDSRLTPIVFDSDTMDWDDLKYVLAIARSGSAAAAGRAMNVNSTTVSRRLNSIEDTLGVRLFDRLHNALSPTDAGRVAVESAERIEREIFDLDGELKASRQLTLSGPR
ncbi:MAG: LysR family transcriptional regulator, partial [Myxococcota bacterium]